VGVLDRDTLPDVRRPREARGQLYEAPSPLRQDLKDMPVRFRHDIEGSADVLVRHRLVKQIAHRVDEDLPRLPPAKRKIKLIRM